MDKKKTMLTGMLLFGLGIMFFLWYGTEIKNWFNLGPYSKLAISLGIVAIIILVRRKINSDDQ